MISCTAAAVVQQQMAMRVRACGCVTHQLSQCIGQHMCTQHKAFTLRRAHHRHLCHFSHRKLVAGTVLRSPAVYDASQEAGNTSTTQSAVQHTFAVHSTQVSHICLVSHGQLCVVFSPADARYVIHPAACQRNCGYTPPALSFENNRSPCFPCAHYTTYFVLRSNCFPYHIRW